MIIHGKECAIVGFLKPELQLDKLLINAVSKCHIILRFNGKRMLQMFLQ